jgi:UPF0113 Pre-PUA domain
MRPLTETETQTLFAKLANYTGNSLKNLIAPLDNGPNADRYVFRLHQSRCYYVRLSLANLATSISRDKLLSLGTCLGISLPSAILYKQLTLRRQVYQNWKVPPPHHSSSYPRRARTVQGLGQGKWGDAISVRRTYCKGARWTSLRGLPRAPRCHCLQHE